MQISEIGVIGRQIRGQRPVINRSTPRLAIVAAFLALMLAGNNLLAADPTTSDPDDPLLNLFLQKGFITQSEADKARAEVAAMRTNEISELAPAPSKWKLSPDIKSVEFFGDVKMRYEDRTATGPTGVKVDYQRERYALYFGFRGDAFDDFYYGFRLETASNPRSPWVTFGQEQRVSSGSPNTVTPYQGPFGKSEGSLNIGQVYLGWKPESWFDVTVGKMPNPLYTTSLVWDPDLNPEGLAERFKVTVGEADFFATFGQFIYADQNPTFASAGLDGTDGDYYQGQDVQNNLFMVTWSGGLIYHITTNITAKVGANVYQYFGATQSQFGDSLTPFFGDVYVGEGAYAGSGANAPYNVPGYSGYGYQSPQQPVTSANYPNNQVGVNDLLVLEVPFEIDFKFHDNKLNAKIFGDVAYNFQGEQRAEAAQAAYASFLSNPAVNNGSQVGIVSPFAPQTSDNKAYQFGVAIGDKDGVGMVYSGEAPKHAWEARTYWQHIEQYSLDPNLIDSDFFEGAENLQGIYAAFAYGFTDNFIGTFRYGYASRINSQLGTGGSDQDIPQVNPIDKYQMFQFDLSYKF
jgi:hypothetical protein